MQLSFTVEEEMFAPAAIAAAQPEDSHGQYAAEKWLIRRSRASQPSQPTHRQAIAAQVRATRYETRLLLRTVREQTFAS